MRVLGTEIAGFVDAVGRDVARFHTGDQVFGFTGFNLGANAEYACMPESASLEPKPPNMTSSRRRPLDGNNRAATGAMSRLAPIWLRTHCANQRGPEVLLPGEDSRP